MLGPGDITRMQADINEVIGDNDVPIVIRRGATTLPAQTVRVEGLGGTAGRVDQPSSEETKATVFIGGDITLDIQKDDRFTLDGQLFRVTFVRSNKLIGVQAEAEEVQ